MGSSEGKESKASLKVNWNVLKPIMAICNDQMNGVLKILKSPDKRFRRKNDVRVANSAKKGSRLIRKVN